MPAPLTRNLYSMDEVVSALQVSLRASNGRALFWLWELATSLEASTALAAALDAWLLWGGGVDPDILTLPPPTTPTDAHILMTRIQNAIQTARSLNAQRFLAEVTALAEPPVLPSLEEPVPTPPDNEDDPDYGPPLWVGLYTATKVANRRAAFWYLQAATAALCADTAWLFLHALASPTVTPVLTLLQSHATPLPESQLLHQAAALLILCDPVTTLPLVPVKVPHPALAIRDWDAWAAVCGRRKARVHAIPPAALHQGTTRGALSDAYTNIEELRDPAPGLLSGCQFWREAMSCVGATYDPDSDRVTFPSDDALEYFYLSYFPDDIPDEWSAADQQKSHGVGCAETAPPAPLAADALLGGQKVDALANLFAATCL